MRRAELVGLMLLALALTALPVLAGTMYARFSTAVRSGRSLGADTLGTLGQGDAVEVLRKEANYYQVSYRGQVGWVYFNKLTKDKPEDIAALLGGADFGGGIRLAELEAGGALRGLSPMAESYVAAKDVPRWAVQAVEDMQGLAISAAELEDFQREGSLGEYGEGVTR